MLLFLGPPALLHYSFDTATVSGSTLLNLGSGGAAYNAQLINSPAISTSDKMVGTGAIQLTSSLAQYVQIPSFTTGKSGLSIAFWFKITSTETYTCVFDFGNGLYDSIFFGQLNGYGDIYCRNESIVSERLIFFRGSVNDNTWRHVVWTIEPSGVWVIYLNGNILQSYAKIFYPNAVTRTENYIGRSNFEWYPYLNGSIDEFYMFESVLSADQVMQLYSQGENTVGKDFICYAGLLYIYGFCLI